MTPELTLLYMRFQLAVALAALLRQNCELARADKVLEDAQTIADEFAKAIEPKPAPVAYWVLRRIPEAISREPMFIADRTEIVFTPDVSLAKRFESQEQSLAYAQWSNLWKILEPEMRTETPKDTP